TSADGGPDPRTVDPPPAAAIACPGPCRASQGAADADVGGAADAGRGRRRSVPEGHRRFFREYAGGTVGPDPPARETWDYRADALGPARGCPGPLGGAAASAGARRPRARDEAERQATAGRPVPLCLRQGVAACGRSGGLPLAAFDALGPSVLRPATAPGTWSSPGAAGARR